MKRIALGLLLLACIAAAFLSGRRLGPTPVAPKLESRVLYYVDPMHPAYKSDRPGIAPDCGMDLVPVFREEMSGRGSSSGVKPPAGLVTIGSEQQNLIGLQTVAAESSSGQDTLRAIGRVATDESSSYSVTTAVDGWIRDAKNYAVGSRVTKDETLAEFYSPEFTALEQGYLVATERSNSTVKQLAAPGTQTTSTRLRNYGMGEKQIREIAATRIIPDNVDIVSPATGVIMMRNVARGQRFDKGVELYRIADFSRVWIMASLSEAEAQRLRPGMTVSVSVPGSHRKVRARVSSALPQVDGESRMMNVRLESDNPDFIMKPGMYVDLTVSIKAPAGISIPVDAVLDSGLEQRVYVAGPNSTFEPRTVTTGARFGDRVQVLHGLAAGERVVTEANFLVDSESRLRS